MTLQPSDYIAGISAGTAIFFAARATSVSREFATLERRVAVIESQPRMESTSPLERRISVLESLHQGHNEQIAEIKSETGKMGLQLNELFRQVIAVQEKLSANTALFTDKFDRVIYLLDRADHANNSR